MISRRRFWWLSSVAIVVAMMASCAHERMREGSVRYGAATPQCAPDNGGLTLPPDLCATVFADDLGQARHMAVAEDGSVYVNTWKSPYKKDRKIPAGGYLVRLRDINGDGVAESIERFGEDSAGAAHVGGTGLAIHDGYLYAEATGRIIRYHLVPETSPAMLKPEVVLLGLPLTGNHTMHPFVITRDGTIFVNSGSATNACQVKDRELHSPGIDPCPELATRAGIWKYAARGNDQEFDARDRYASGLRNSVAIALHPSGRVYVVTHGRDQLHENWPELFNEQQGSELPAETLYRLAPGADYGWPYCYFDGFQERYALAPEYGGDGRKIGRCADKPAPVLPYPAHWAPDGMLFYTGTNLPERYRNGAFIAFHGSWNRQQQQGYNVVFTPMDAAGNPRGPPQVFADGFAGPIKSPEGAKHRPTGLAVGPDGALYISDDQGGRIWRVVKR
jgi:glucose/arabinose dehydrogenase